LIWIKPKWNDCWPLEQLTKRSKGLRNLLKGSLHGPVCHFAVGSWKFHSGTIEQVAIIGINENKRAVYDKVQKAGTKGSASLLVDYSDYKDDCVQSSSCAGGGHSAPQTEGCKYLPSLLEGNRSWFRLLI
jgi:hypothetical protein